MADRKTPLRFLLTLAVLGCLITSSLVLTGKIGKKINPADSWVSPTQYAEQADNPLPPRNRVRMQPDQFDALNNPKQLTGTPVANIVVQKDRLDLMVGPSVVWSGPYRAVVGFNGRLTLPMVAALVAKSPKPDWLKVTGSGVYQLSAGLVQAPGTRLEVTGPDVRELRMTFQPYVYMAGVGASALFQDVKVTSWVPATGAPAPNPADHRPFVSYDSGGRLDVVNSQFSYLGTDASKAYGVSWGTGTTGSSVHSEFHHNLFGTYTGGAVGVEFRSNTYHNNARYGLDPHTNSQGLIVVDNEAYGNNTHGIIFSKSVNHSIIEGNKSHDNGSNGIMMDEKCDFNLIRNNEVWNNRGDGIVLQGSSRTVVSDNKISGNQVGVRVNANKLGPTDSSRVSNNEITNNKLGIQIYGGARDTVSQGNQINDSADQAIQFSDPGLSVYDTVAGARKAIVVQPKVTAIVRGLRTKNVGRGIVVAQGGRADVLSSQITGKDIAIEVESDGHISLSGTDAGALTTVSGAKKGLVVAGTADLKDVSISDVDRGVLVSEGGSATINTTSLVTSSKGVEVEGFNGQSRVHLVAPNDIRAPIPMVGSTLWQESGNELSAIPSWLAVAGALFVLLAVMLHIGHRMWAPLSHVRHQSYPALDGVGSRA